MDEAEMYYYGLPSKPRLIARTGTAMWEAPTGPEAYYKPKVLRIAGEHAIETSWEQDIAPKIHDILEVKQLDWSSIDVVRIGYADKHSGELVIWIGVRDGSLSYNLAFDAAQECKKILLAYHIYDIEVEIRVSDIIKSAGPPLLEPGFDTDPTADVRDPFTSTLGITICSQRSQWAEGTASLFLGDGNDATKLLLVTARHVVFPEPDNSTYEYKFTSAPRRDVLLLSNTSFGQCLQAIDKKAKGQDTIFNYQQKRFDRLEGREDSKSIKDREDAGRLMEKAKEDKKLLEEFYKEILLHWATEDDRVLGHIIFSPPIAVGDGPEDFTQDIAVIDVDPSKVDPSTYKGNVVDLGHKFTPEDLTDMMHPNAKNSHNFDFPGDRLLRLSGTIGVEEMNKPTMYDKNGERCILVLKKGRTTGLTVGRANNINSYTRLYFGNKTFIAREWPILPFDKDSGAFSDRGDSGAVVFDGAGRIGGILTGGGGATQSSDVTYVTPISVVLKIIHSHKPLAEAYIKSAQSA